MKSSEAGILTTGIPSQAELDASPGYPHPAALARGPLVVIECKRPDLDVESGKAFEEAVSQMLRNQDEEEIPHLFTYAQLLLAVSVNHARYAPTGASKEFWSIWRLRPNGVSFGTTDRQFDSTEQSPQPSQTRSLMTTRRFGSSSLPRLRRRRFSVAQVWA